MLAGLARPEDQPRGDVIPGTIAEGASLTEHGIKLSGTALEFPHHLVITRAGQIPRGGRPGRMGSGVAAGGPAPWEPDITRVADIERFFGG
jgi:hypothetical protein